MSAIMSASRIIINPINRELLAAGPEARRAGWRCFGIGSRRKAISLSGGADGARTMATTGTKRQKCLSLENMNPCVKVMEYAVRGPLVIRASEIEKELEQVRVDNSGAQWAVSYCFALVKP